MSGKGTAGLRHDRLVRCLLLCVTLAVSGVLGVAMPAVAMPAAANPSASTGIGRVVQVVQLPPTVDRRALLDLGNLLSHPGHVVVVEVLAPATLQNAPGPELTGIADPAPGSFLVVSLDYLGGGGTAGALLFELASVRVAEPAAAAAAERQSAVTLAALGTHCQGRCDQAIRRQVTIASHRTYPTLAAFLAAQPSRVRVVPAGVLGPTAVKGSPAARGPTASPRGTPMWGTGLVGALAVAAVAGWYLALRRKLTPSSPPRRRDNRTTKPSPRPQPGRPLVRTGTAARRAGPPIPALVAAASSAAHDGRVRTELHPQGYVELDGCLYRATWIGPGTPGPGPGESVRVTTDRTHGLVALPNATTAASSPSATADPRRPGR
jgi:hypothetical protein